MKNITTVTSKGQIINIPQINCNQEMVNKAIPLYIKYKKNSFVDACLVTYAELNNAVPLLTLDRDLVNSFPESVIRF